MQENRAAAPGDARTGVVVEFDNQIIEVVFPPQAIARFIGRPAEWLIVPPIAGILRPG
jgi:hypothetical protein